MKVNVNVTIGELRLQNSELERLVVTQELGQHTYALIEFTRDRAQPLALEEVLRQPVVVTVREDDGDPIEIFQGRVEDGSQSHLLHFGARFVLNAVSPSVRHEFTEAVYYPESTLGSIAGQLGVRLVGQPRREPEPFNYVQWGESEIDFLRRLADEHGCFLVTTGPTVEIRSDFQDKGWELVWGESLLEVSAHAAPVNHGITGASYSPADKSTHRHHGVRQGPGTIGGASRLVTTLNEIARTFGDGGDPLFIEPTGRASSHADFKQMLKLESERAIGSALLVHGATGKPGLIAGDLVDLVEGSDFRLPTSGRLGLVKVTHEFHDQHYLNRFVATPWKNFSNLSAPPRRVLDGPVTGEVVETSADPERQGRVRVAYRWQTGNEATAWARFAGPYAGNDRGVFFQPEVGDEVLIEFEQGDPERPIIVGSLWNGRDLPPESREGNEVKWIRTRSGNSIRFVEGSDGEAIELFTPEGECIVKLSNEGGNSVLTLYSEGDLHFEAKGEIRMKSQSFSQETEGDHKSKVGGKLSADATGEIAMKSGMSLGLQAGLNAVLKGGANVELVATAVNNVVGGMVQIQPPGFAASSVSPASVSIDSFEPEPPDTPVLADPTRTADAPTPRSGAE